MCTCISHGDLKSNSPKTKPIIFQEQNPFLCSQMPVSQCVRCSNPALATSLASLAIPLWRLLSCRLSHWESCFLEGTSLPRIMPYVSLASGSLIQAQAFLCSSATSIFLKNKSDHCQAPPEKPSGPPSCLQKGLAFLPLVDTLWPDPCASSVHWPCAAPPQFSDGSPVRTPSYICMFLPPGVTLPQAFLDKSDSSSLRIHPKSNLFLRSSCSPAPGPGVRPCSEQVWSSTALLLQSSFLPLPSTAPMS